MKWNRKEIDQLFPILEQVSSDLSPVDGKNILILCSAMGEVAFWLGEMMEQGQVTGLELDPESVEIARRTAHEMGLEHVVKFEAAEKDHIPSQEGIFDGLVSEFIVYPTSTPTEIGQIEMARVLKPGGKMILTDVIMAQPLPDIARHELNSIGLDYLCEGKPEDFRKWMAEAGLVNVEVIDMTPTLIKVWENRRINDRSSSHQVGYSYLLDDQTSRLGKAIFYIYVRGEKPKPHP